MDKCEAINDGRVTSSKSLDSSQSDQAEKKKTLCKRTRACFRRISLVEYRTPLYFGN